MKKFAFVSLFALVAFGVAFGATTGGVALSGSVAEQFDLVIQNASVPFSITDGSNNVALGTFTAKSNYKNWSIKVSSANNGVLSLGAGETISYTFKLMNGVTALTNLNGVALTTAGITQSFTSRTAKAGLVLDASITYDYTGLNYAETGTYTDTVTVTITHP
jgi:hypothetical protein